MKWKRSSQGLSWASSIRNTNADTARMVPQRLVEHCIFRPRGLCPITSHDCQAQAVLCVQGKGLTALARNLYFPSQTAFLFIILWSDLRGERQLQFIRLRWLPAGHNIQLSLFSQLLMMCLKKKKVVEIDVSCQIKVMYEQALCLVFPCWISVLTFSFLPLDFPILHSCSSWLLTAGTCPGLVSVCKSCWCSRAFSLLFLGSGL